MCGFVLVTKWARGMSHQDAENQDGATSNVSFLPRLRKCHLEARACQEMASVLSTSRHLVELDLTGNALEDLGLKLLCQGLRNPVCRLQTLW